MAKRKVIKDNDQTKIREDANVNIWLSENLYLPVDHHGHVAGPCAEGALGFVVQIREAVGGGRLALKLPRLTGETYQENAYISELMDKELDAVRVIHRGFGSSVEQGADIEHAGDASFADYAQELLDAQLFGRGGLLRGRIVSQNGPPEAQRFHDAFILVRFEKGRKPKICAVKADNDKIVCLPEGVNDCPVRTPDDLKQIERAAKTHYPWSQTVFVESHIDKPLTSAHGLVVLRADQAVENAATGQMWYVALPTVAYTWAYGTLQEAISKNTRGNWEIHEHLALVQRIADGLNSLHKKHMLHGDLRPANVMHIGNPEFPKNYVVTDYGSFHITGPQGDTINGNLPKGATQLATGGTERFSVFYSAERRAGRERETADTAVIIPRKGTNELTIVTGWRSDLIDEETSLIKDSVEQEAQNTLKKKSSGDDNLSMGDRIQIRDYIFDIESSAEHQYRQVYKCLARSWKVYHGRIVIENTDQFTQDEWFPIPRVIELRQWSAASDLYSLGALFLYSVFCSVESTEQRYSSQDEEDFRVMLSHLESLPYFNSIWKDLESLRSALEENLNRSSLDNFGDIPFTNLNDEEEETEEGKSKTLGDKTLEVVNRMTGTVPGIRRVLEAFVSPIAAHDDTDTTYYGLGHFVFFIHFVLCCLHRRSHFDDKSLNSDKLEKSKRQVFCGNRREKPEDGAILNASQRLTTIRQNFGGDRFNSLRYGSSEILNYDPRPDTTIRESLVRVWNEFNSNLEENKHLRDGFLIKLALNILRKTRQEYGQLDTKAINTLNATRPPEKLKKSDDEKEVAP